MGQSLKSQFLCQTENLTRTIGSIHRHLETAHTLRLVKYWEYGVCGFAGDDPTLKEHYQRLHSNQNSSPSIQFAGISSIDGCNRDSSAAVISLEEVAATEDERVELSVVEIPAIEEFPADWLPKAQILQDPSPEQSRGNPDKRKRNQNRQMQKARQQNKQKAYEARKIQRLFNFYPKRDVREVLESCRSPPYDGTVQVAEEYLKWTYNRLRPSSQQCQSARELYDTCHWSQPSEDQMSFLNRAPTQQELEASLRRATNTSPGVDGLEYRHLRAIDPNCILLEMVCKMVWKLGIPNCWKTSRTVPIFKKRYTSDYSNFRPISLLPTIYKLFSGVISQRITEDLGWLSPEQKGFLQGGPWYSGTYTALTNGCRGDKDQTKAHVYSMAVHVQRVWGLTPF
ncbi:Uncharacterized protein APZ42_029867 [Daphnia magna]|uniref:Reverse transcriptase domain-containing protein n=1 Tax=Daphnia magna TaxID=35525 RepID=A0A164P944_9CRUS|nr:Uncharacterized protein APZ42_029867 [Daphnia magna]